MTVPPSDRFKAAVFTAGDGQRYGLVSREGSGQVVVFKWTEPKWRGHIEFGPFESTGLWPGEAVEAITAALDEKEGDR